MVEAPRGEIIDRNGVPIASNKLFIPYLYLSGHSELKSGYSALSELLVGESSFHGMNARQIEWKFRIK
jgi:hypothetical protein